MTPDEHLDDESAALYLVDELDPAATEAVDRHLLACQTCWDDIRLAGLGRQALLMLREPGPAAVAGSAANIDPAKATHPAEAPETAWAHNVLGRVVDLDRGVRPSAARRRPPVAVSVGLILTAALIFAVGLLVAPRSARVVQADPGERIAQAGASAYLDGIPGTAAHLRAPTVGHRFRCTRAVHTVLAGQPVDGYLLSAPGGDTVALYTSSRPFPSDRHAVAGPVAQSRLVAVHGMSAVTIGARHPALIIGERLDLVTTVARAMSG